jgi:hypothetical protein
MIAIGFSLLIPEAFTAVTISQQAVSDLRAEIQRLKAQEVKLESDLSGIRGKIRELQQQLDAALLSQMSKQDTPLVFFVPEKTTIYFFNEPSYASLAGELSGGDVVEILDHVEGFYKGICRKILCYIPDGIVATQVSDSQLTEFRKANDIRLLELKKKTEMEKSARAKLVAQQEKAASEKKRKERQDQLTGRFGAEVAAKIMKRMFWIGMTAEIAKESLGPPLENNRTVLATGTHEQWVYGERLLLYFENGILVSFQDKK